MEVKLAKIAYIDELKKEGKDDTGQQAVGASKATPDKSKKLKKAEGDEFPQAAVIAAKAALGFEIYTDSSKFQLGAVITQTIGR